MISRGTILSILGLAAIFYVTAAAQDLAGDWQGTLQTGRSTLRLVLHFAKANDATWRATMCNIDDTPDRGAGIAMTSVVIHGAEMRLTADSIRGSYQGKLSPDGKTISGIWMQGPSLVLNFERATKDTAWADPSPHRIELVTVDQGIDLEVLDWGGTGRPLVLLAGLGNTAHVFDKFAPKLASRYHVYGITRRGFGLSSAPVPDQSNYGADRLGDDVLAVIESLKINRPVLVGHSIAGEELSSVATRHPERIAGLVYLDAGYAYAYYDRTRGDFTVDTLDLRRKLGRLIDAPPQEQKQIVSDMLQTDLAQFQKDLRERQKELEAAIRPGGSPIPTPNGTRSPSQAIFAGQQKYTDIRVPVLAFYAVPHARFARIADPEERAAAEKKDREDTGAQAKALEAGVPSARVVRLANASHYVFVSNEDDVLRQMVVFLNGLKTD